MTENETEEFCVKLVDWLKSNKVDVLFAMAYQGADPPKRWLKDMEIWNRNIDSLIRKANELVRYHTKPDEAQKQ